MPPSKPRPSTPAAVPAERRKRLDALRREGNAYPNDFKRKQLVAELVERYERMPRDALDTNPVVVQVAGRMMSTRLGGKASFAMLQDMSGHIQLYLTDAYPGKHQHQAFKQWAVGDIIGVEGVLFKTRENEITVRVRSARLLAGSLWPLPEHLRDDEDRETPYRQRYLDLIVNEDARLKFVHRSRAVQALRKFLVDRAYLEVETPIMHPVAAGAAGRAFRTHHNALDMALHLRTASDLHLLRLLVAGFEKVFEMNRVFRQDAASPWHAAEFTVLAFYVAYRDTRHVMSAIEMLLGDAAQESIGTKAFPFQGHTIDLAAPYERLTMAEAIGRHHPAVNDALPGDRLALFESTVAPQLVQPTFVVGYPLESAPYAQRSDQQEGLADHYRLYIGGHAIASGRAQLSDPEEHRERMRLEPGDADYLRALEYGLPPTAGARIGVDRFVMLLTDSASIRDVILFPQVDPPG